MGAQSASVTNAFAGYFETSKIELFAKIVNSFSHGDATTKFHLTKSF